MDLELFEAVTGARLHVNAGTAGSFGSALGTVGTTSANVGTSACADITRNTAISELLLLAGTALRVNRSRFFANLNTSLDISAITGVSGYLLTSAGCIDASDDATSAISLLKMSTISGFSMSCSLSRHIARMFATSI